MEGRGLKDHSGSNQFTTQLTDQEYLVARAREAAARGEDWGAKTWMLTAKSLFPDNFGIQFEAYTTEREAGNAKESAVFFQDLFAKFPQEGRIVAEIGTVMAVLNNEEGGKEETEQSHRFYASMFSQMSESFQKKMILAAAEGAKDPLEHCTLMLILLRKFPDRIPQHGERLIETLNTAEKHELGVTPQPLNIFRRMLVVEVLPTVLRAERTKVAPKLVLKNLLKAQEFVVALVNKRSMATFEVRGDPWELVYQCLVGAGRALGWPLQPQPSVGGPQGSNTQPSPGIEEFLAICGNLARSQPAPDSASSQQLFHTVATCCLHAIFQYHSLLKDKEVVLLEAFVTHDTTDKTLGSKRRKTQDDPSSSLPLVTHGACATLDDPLVHAFQVSCSAWQLVTSSSQLETKFQALVLQLSAVAGPLNMVTAFSADYRLQSGQLREALGDVRQLVGARQGSCEALQPSNCLKLATVHYCLGDRRGAAAQAIDTVKGMGGLPGGLPEPQAQQHLIQGLTWPTTRTRHLRFLPLSRAGVLTYVCKLLICLLQEKALQHNTGGDLAMGHIITILQYNWPDQRELFHMLIHRIRKKEAFSYPLFSQYVVNIDILEEMMYLSSEQGGGLVLDILGSPGGGVPAARPGTRGANRGEKEDFRQAMRRQAARSLEPVDRNED